MRLTQGRPTGGVAGRPAVRWLCLGLAMSPAGSEALRPQSAGSNGGKDGGLQGVAFLQRDNRAPHSNRNPRPQR
ncbi:MAG: hypothetical protein MZV49_21520 [Rhodopseudomonas palustris]|nr:hypothetical protein [Rhodopseudomonas palustris]